MKKNVFLFSFFLVFATCASALEWFDAGIGGYEDWPTDGSDHIVVGTGTWLGTYGGSLLGDAGNRRLKIESSIQDPLVFLPAVSRPINDGELVLSLRVNFTAAFSALPQCSNIAKGAITVTGNESGGLSYYGWAKDPVGATNRWIKLSGLLPVLNQEVQIDVKMRKTGGTPQISYSVAGTLLTADGRDWLDIVCTDDSFNITKVKCVGTGELSQLSGASDYIVPSVVLTIPELDHLTVSQVTVAGVPVESNAEGNYQVPEGALVSVAFKVAGGYVSNGTGMDFRVDQSMTLPEEGRPMVASAAEVLSINEIMASNGNTLTTRNGGTGLDWVELKNDADFDIDLTGWYLSDNPDKKITKWEKIHGSCVIPAHSFKIVWADKAYNSFAANEAYTRIGLSSSGEPLFLASPDGVKIQQIDFGKQIKDISVGSGGIQRTVFNENGNAQYRVGDGQWQEVSGPVGMSALNSGFTVVAYRMDSTVTDSETAESMLADPSHWLANPTVNLCETIAFNDDGSPTAGYSYTAFPGVSGDNFVVVVTGTVLIPEAGLWTFSCGSDDGFTAALSRRGQSWTWEYTASRSYAQTHSTFSLPEAGAYDLRLVYFEKGGGAALDLSVAAGEKAWEEDRDDFHLLGSAASGVGHAGAMDANIAVNVADEMLGKTASLDWRGTFNMDGDPPAKDSFLLRLRYADGFVAKLNGVEFASVPTAKRSVEAALAYEYFDIPVSLVHNGENTLEITAYNNSADDPDFLLAPEVLWNDNDGELVYYEKPTPNAENGAGRSGPTSEVAFSVPHGWKTAPFQLELSCADNPGAAIYYTTNGTSPSAASTLYTGPITISRTTCVRAAVPDSDSILQIDTSATYLFLNDVLVQNSNPPSGFPASQSVNNQKMVYGMNQTIVSNYRDRLLAGFTNSIDTLSLVIDPANLFNSSTGIYVNATGDGRRWERKTMLELISPTNSAAEFSVPAGIRIRGAYSRGSSYPKHSFRFFFRSEYGMGKLDFPLFGDEGTDTFDKIDLRTAQNYSWANGNNSFTFIEECFSRDSQRDMGEPYNRSRYYNLFINGTYWGVYQTEERVDGNYGESYFGGNSDDYDVVRTSQPGYVTGVVEGETKGWENFWDITVNQGYGASHSNNYRRVLGLNPDGTPNPAYPVYLDATNIMVHVLTSHFANDTDAPAAGTKANNMAALRNRYDGTNVVDGITKRGWVFNRHDAEHSMGANGKSATDNLMTYGTEVYNANFKTLANFNPMEMHYKLCDNAEYKLAFGDLIYRECVREGGAMTVAKASERFRKRMAELDDAVVCEAARWGGGSRTRDTWISACNARLSFISARTDVMVSQYRSVGWYPSINAPTAVNAGNATIPDKSVMERGEKVYLTGGTSGTVYYTTDGSDPRVSGGSVSGSALTYTGGLPPVGYAEAFSKGSSWKYYDNGNEPGTDAAGNSWKSVQFNDSGWSSGTGSFGFANSISFSTKLSRYVNHASSGTQVTTYYFRKSVTLPASAAKAASIKVTAYFDDGYILYVNGVEVGRSSLIPAGEVSYSTYTTGYINPADAEAEYAIPVGLLKAGTNVIAAEVHQANATSSDVAWDLAFSYPVTGSSEGGLAVPAAGMRLRARVLSSTGEWSALEAVDIVDTVAPSDSDLAMGLRVAEVMSVSADNDGDGAEFIGLTNLLAAASLDLSGVRIAGAKSGSANASLELVLPAGLSLPPAGSLVLTKALYWPDTKITNGKVDLRLSDAAGSLIQNAGVDSDWWDKACDGTGASFIAQQFGTSVTEQDQWRPSFVPPADNTGKDGIANAVAANDRVRVWLNSLWLTAAGRAAISSFSGGPDALTDCWLVNTVPESEPEIGLDIPWVTNESNSIRGSARLTVHGAERLGPVNGVIRLYYSETVEGLSSSTNFIPLDAVFPLEDWIFNIPGGAGERFFRIKVEVE